MTFTIPGKPQGKGRARFGNGRTYTPPATEDYMNLIRFCFKQAGGEITENPVEVEITAYMPIPSSAPKKVKEAMHKAQAFPCGKPDNDNIEKVVFDALNGYAWHDDTQVVDNRTFKRYAETPCVEVKITELYARYIKKDGRWMLNEDC